MHTLVPCVIYTEIYSLRNGGYRRPRYIEYNQMIEAVQAEIHRYVFGLILISCYKHNLQQNHF